MVDTPTHGQDGFPLAPEKFRLDCNGVLEGDRSKRSQPGLGPQERKKHHNGKVFFLDSEYVASAEPMPSDLIKMAQEVLGQSYFDDDGTIRFKCFFHPLFKRWVFAEKWRPKEANDLKRWGHEVWRVFYIVQEDSKPEYCPPDYQDDPLRAYLTGFIGDFKQVDRRDFEIARDFDMRYKHEDDIENYFRALEAEVEAETEDEWEAWAADFLSYHFWMAQTEAKAKYENVGKAYSTAQRDVVKGVPVSHRAMDAVKEGRLLMPSQRKTVWVATGEHSGYFSTTKLPREQYLTELLEWMKQELDDAYKVRFPEATPSVEEKLLVQDLLARAPEEIPERYRPLLKMREELDQNLERYATVNSSEMMVKFAQGSK